LCSGKRRWTMTVPAEPDRDSDLVIGGALANARRLVATLDAVPLDVERLARAFHILHSPFDEAQCVERDVEDARLMAREYARLASSEPREDDYPPEGPVPTSVQNAWNEDHR
ncbi:MAG TPA: hypothetical protein VFX15_02700, partial [Actinomycetes bacterium]|nr:hypothetical protein [Actinomycetes bacterium]